MQGIEEVAQPGRPKSYIGLPLRERLRRERPLTSYTKVQAVIGKLIRNRLTLGVNHSEYLNAGCGPNVRADFVNLDYHWRPGVHACWDLSRRLPLRDGSMRGVYTEHCLEHLSVDVCLRVLREFYRTLRPAGTLRVVVPDAELYLQTYLAIRAGDNRHFPYGPVTPTPGWTPMQEVNRVFRDFGHQYAYDFETLSELLEKAGFRKVTRCTFRQGRVPQLLIDSQERECESLYVEATR